MRSAAAKMSECIRHDLRAPPWTAPSVLAGLLWASLVQWGYFNSYLARYTSSEGSESTDMHHSNSELVHAFPADLRDNAVLALSAFPENPHPSKTFSARVADQIVVLPDRIYHDPALIDTVPLNTVQKELVDCLLTRHHDGLVREKHLTRIISRNHIWIPPFVVQLAGEYVIEILHVIRHNLSLLDASIYGEFLRTNPELFALTKQRVASYWDCYYRDCRREEYVGFQVLDFLQSLVGKSH